MTRIVVISDTHLECLAFGLPDQVMHEIMNCDLVIHAGDFTKEAVYNQLCSIANIAAVRGNMDNRYLREKLPVKQRVTIDNLTIGVIHGRGSPQETVRYARSEFDDVDLIVFGHSHVPFHERIGGIIMFNPGSPTCSRFTAAATFGLIELGNGRIEPRIMEVQFH